MNQFSGSALFYAAVFVPSEPSTALAALPTFLNFSGGAFSSVGASPSQARSIIRRGRVYFSTKSWRFFVCPRKAHISGRL